MKNPKVTFEVRTLSDRYAIKKMIPHKEERFSGEETVCEIKISGNSDQYCRIICEALNKKYKAK